MRNRRIGAVAVVAALTGSTVLAAGATPALADSGKALPLKSVGDLVVDGAHQRIFVSDPDSGKIVETRYDGTVAATASGLPRVTGLALSRDGNVLYGALESGRAIVALSAATLTEPVRYDLGAGVYPLSLESAGGKLWFSYDNYGKDPYIGSEGNIGSLDLGGAKPVVALEQDTTGAYHLWSGAPELTSTQESTPGDSALLAAFDPHTSSGVVAVYNVAGGAFTRTGAQGITKGYTRDVAFTPDSAQVVAADSTAVTVARSTDLTPTGSYPVNGWAKSVAVASDGTVAIGGSEVRIFAPGKTVPIRRYTLPRTDPTTTGNDEVADRALAWEPGGNRLFAITDNYSAIHHLRVYTEPKKSPPSLKLSGPASAARGRPLTVTGSLTASIPLPAGTRVTVTRTDLENPSGKSLGTLTTAANGSFSVTDTPSAGGTVTYRASYAGDAKHSAVTATKSVSVSRTSPVLTINNNKKTFGYGRTVTFTAKLGATYKNRVVEIWADPSGGDQGRRLLKRAVASRSGTVSASLRLTRDTTVSAVFTGDPRTAPKTVKATVGTKVNVSLKVSKHYRTGKIGKTKYHYVHVKTKAKLTVKMTAGPKARKAYVGVQFFSKGKWRAWNDGYFPAAEAVHLDATGFKGYKLRVRAAYRKGSSGDSVNTTTWTPYQYIYITK
ncbi:Ig-like domain-containing protein [Actinoplanes missouriensis]|nr:Ig-like domain-containing protein [Actinoplanes missouriensis]